jgi:hypothetical protein
MKLNKIGKAERDRHLEVPSQVVYYDFASKNNLPQLSRYISDLKADLKWLHEKLEQEVKAEKCHTKKTEDFEVDTLGHSS